MNESPTLMGRIEGPYLKAYCPHCKREHIHGAPAPGTRSVHRVAHCPRPSPYDSTGYTIEIETPKK